MFNGDATWHTYSTQLGHLERTGGETDPFQESNTTTRALQGSLVPDVSPDAPLAGVSLGEDGSGHALLLLGIALGPPNEVNVNGGLIHDCHKSAFVHRGKSELDGSWNSRTSNERVCEG
jgi:hypothetical protein